MSLKFLHRVNRPVPPFPIPAIFDDMSRRGGNRSRRWWGRRGCFGPDGSAAHRSPFESRGVRCALALAFSEGARMMKAGPPWFHV